MRSIVIRATGPSSSFALIGHRVSETGGVRTSNKIVKALVVARHAMMIFF